MPPSSPDSHLSYTQTSYIYNTPSRPTHFLEKLTSLRRVDIGRDTLHRPLSTLGPKLNTSIVCARQPYPTKSIVGGTDCAQGQAPSSAFNPSSAPWSSKISHSGFFRLDVTSITTLVISRLSGASSVHRGPITGHGGPSLAQ